MAATIQSKQSYVWDGGRYLDSGGRPIAPVTVRGWVDSAVDATKAKIKADAELFTSGKISHDEFFVRLETDIKRMHSGVAQIASGGKAQMTNTLNGRLGSRVRQQLSYLQKFERAVANDEFPLTGVVNRAMLYADSAVGTYEGMRQGLMVDSGMTEAKNMLGDAIHCSECPELSARGYIPINEMPPVGSRECGPRDRCSVEYR